MKQLPTTVTAKMFIHVSKHSEIVELFPFDMTEMGYISLGTTEVTFDVPQIDLVAAEIAAVEKEKAQIVTEYETKLTRINEKLQNLRALTFDGAEW